MDGPPGVHDPAPPRAGRGPVDGAVGEAAEMTRELRALLDLVLPAVCAGCGDPGSMWCRRCHPPPGPALRVGVPALPAGPPVYALAGYSGPVRAVLLGYKERGSRVLVGPLGTWLAGGLEELPAGLRRCCTGSDGCWWLVPVPSRRPAAVRRGGQHVAAVAAHAAAVLA
ncbi:MAG: ComF family protein, partial [Pseudonocardiaceae bacterium]